MPKVRRHEFHFVLPPKQAVLEGDQMARFGERVLDLACRFTLGTPERGEPVSLMLAWDLPEGPNGDSDKAVRLEYLYREAGYHLTRRTEAVS